MRCLGLMTREDLTQKREDNDPDLKVPIYSFILQNEVDIYNSTGLDERTANIKSGIEHNAG